MIVKEEFRGGLDENNHYVSAVAKHFPRGFFKHKKKLYTLKEFNPLIKMSHLKISLGTFSSLIWNLIRANLMFTLWYATNVELKHLF